MEIEEQEIALQAIHQRAVYDLKLNKYVFVNKLIYWEDELVILGHPRQYKMSDYGKTWRLAKDSELGRKYTLHSKFEEWLDYTKKLQKRNENE